MTSEIMRALTSYQAEFVRQFLDPESDRAHLLTAPDGGGFNQVTIEIIGRIIADRPFARVLLLSGRMALLQWLRDLDGVAGPSRILEGSRRNLRQLAEGAVTDSIWPEGKIVLMESWSLGRFSDLDASVHRTPWDLVVLDGFRVPTLPGTSIRLSLLHRLLQSDTAKRILALNRDRMVKGLPELAGMHTTTWDRALIARSNERAQRIRPLEVSICYRRTEAEEEMIRKIETFVGKWRKSLPQNSSVFRLHVAAKSSPFALQESLQRLRLNKMSMILRQSSLPEEAASTGDEESSGPPTQESRLSGLAEEVSIIQDELDGLVVDSKLETFLRYLRENVSHYNKIIVECRYAATARYLESATNELGRRVFLTLSETPAREKLRMLAEFESMDAILITTVSALQGIELAADLLVEYDASDSWMRLYGRARIVGTANGTPLQIVSIVNEAERDSALDSEDEE